MELMRTLLRPQPTFFLSLERVGQPSSDHKATPYWAQTSAGSACAQATSILTFQSLSARMGVPDYQGNDQNCRFPIADYRFSKSTKNVELHVNRQSAIGNRQYCDYPSRMNILERIRQRAAS